MTPPEQRADQLACNHPGHALNWRGSYHVACGLCGLVVPENCVARGFVGASNYGESAIARETAQAMHDEEDYRAAEDEFLLREHGYSPQLGNVPPHFLAIKWEFRRKWMADRDAKPSG